MFKRNHLSTKKTGVRTIARGSSKFGNKKSEFEGKQFDSTLELNVYKDFKLMAISNQIKSVEAHPAAILLLEAQKVNGKCLHKQITFNPDFKVELNNGKVVYFDTKSWATLCAAYQMKVKLLYYFHGLDCYTIFSEHARHLRKIVEEINNGTYIQTYSRAATLKKGYK